MGTGPYADKGPWMVSILTVPECRGKGVGSRMLRQAMLHAKEKCKLRQVLLWTDHEAALYARLGWKLVHSTPKHAHMHILSNT
jgi:N-acetylglutamate synthase-like GNAT family acetyltransferase